MMKRLFIVLSILACSLHHLNAQNVGINTTDPDVELDVRASIHGADLNLSTPSIDNFLRLRSNSKTDFNPAIWWQNGKHLKMFMADESEANMNEILRLDGKTIHILNTGQSTFMGLYAGNNDNGVFRQNVGVGDSTLYHNVSGLRNVGVGFSALRFGTGGSENTAIGYRAMNFANGNNNTAVGFRALFNNTNADDNTAVGHGALENNLSGTSNTAMGRNALRDNDSGLDNTAVGRSAMIERLSGHSNVAIGRNALFNNESGDTNTALGRSALFSNESGSGNIGIGYQAGSNELGSNKLYIDNSNTSSPLIYGDFSSNLLRTNGKQEVTGDLEVLGNAFYIDQSTRRAGIGTTVPISELHVKDGGFTYALLEAGTNQDAVLALKNTSTGNGDTQWTMRMDGSESNRFQWRYDTESKMVLSTGGFLGVGTITNPQAELHLKDPGFTYALLEAGPDKDAVLSLKNTSSANNDSQWTMRMDGSHGDRFQWRHNNSSRMILTTAGDLVLGKDTPAAGYKLSVNGKIIAEEIRIQLDGLWPDYVFNEDYPLLSIDQLEKSIEKHGHLPGIPDAKTIEEEGFDSGEMQRKIMEKIEELTLYVIELKKENDKLKQVIDQIQNDKKH